MNDHLSTETEGHQLMRQRLFEQLMFRANLFNSANEQIQTFLFSVHGGGLVAALAFLSSDRGKMEIAWLAHTIAILIAGVVLCGFIRALSYFATRGLMVAMGVAIKRFDTQEVDLVEAMAISIPKPLIWLGHLAVTLGVVSFLLFIGALCITVDNLLLPQLLPRT